MTIASDFATTPSPSLHLLSRDHCGRNHQDQNRGNEAYSMVQYQRQNVENSVQKSSIQNQFTVLSNQRDKFVRDREEAERELKQVQTEHQFIKKELETLTESNRRSKEGLGQRMEKLVLLKKEESRLRQITENEFQSIQSCTTHSKMMEEKTNEATRQHTAEMDALNFELGALLERRVQKKTERYITVRSIEKVFLPEFDKALRDNNRPQLLNEKERIHESFELLKSATSEREKCIALLAELRGVQKQQNGDQTNNESVVATGNAANSQSNHIQLFYGNSTSD